jgi:hypothetical protein
MILVLDDLQDPGLWRPDGVLVAGFNSFEKNAPSWGAAPFPRPERANVAKRFWFALLL